MNQILMVENNGKKKSNSPVETKKIVLFFSIAIIIFGVALIAVGAINMGKNKKNSSTNNPSVIGNTTPEVKDPIESDEEKPTIELKVSADRKNIIMVARDETKMDYIEYNWNDEEKQIAYIDNDKNKIEAITELKSGVNTLYIKAVDEAGNEEIRSEKFEKRYPVNIELLITETGDGLIIKASCEDGIRRIDFTQNGKRYTLPLQDPEYPEYTQEQLAGLGAIVEYSDDHKITKVEYTYKGMLEGENRFSVSVYSIKGEVEAKNGTHTYTLQGQ